MIAADTVINATPGHCEILNKPRNADQAEDMLNRLNNKEHQVLTAVHVIFRKNNGQVDERHFVESTLVKFSDIDPGLMKACKSENPFWYPEFILVALVTDIASGEPFDKAGGYGIQGPAAMFIEKIDGDYFNVVSKRIIV